MLLRYSLDLQAKDTGDHLMQAKRLGARLSALCQAAPTVVAEEEREGRESDVGLEEVGLEERVEGVGQGGDRGEMGE